MCTALTDVNFLMLRGFQNSCHKSTFDFKILALTDVNFLQLQLIPNFCGFLWKFKGECYLVMNKRKGM
ncbi:hypothetical protein L2E82_25392 [Cichorium intybus]|uniref:Uncharacterized protein n=1 Tax=Cichorium intybus TaxID=13427 RepID=A0ACB9E4G9_CICIN|nr:hypothetical protein L2E82_25392 [Cichorium intybus]